MATDGFGYGGIGEIGRSKIANIRQIGHGNRRTPLYQQGFISYPRTETNKFPPELDLASFIEQQTANNQWGTFAQEILNRGIHPRNGEKTDQAHPPIHPIKFAANGVALPRPGDWPVYELVVRHFLACCSRDATGQETKVQVQQTHTWAIGGGGCKT